MADHLPECGYGIELSFDGLIQPAEPCICDRLRQCEQRVREDERQKIRTSYLTGIQVSEVNKAYVSGYKRALDAAREAVATMVIQTVGNSAATVDQALAAIDALREERK